MEEREGYGIKLSWEKWLREEMDESGEERRDGQTTGKSE